MLPDECNVIDFDQWGWSFLDLIFAFLLLSCIFSKIIFSVVNSNFDGPSIKYAG